MQPKRLILFFVLSFLILIGWTALHQKLFPPPAKKPEPARELPVLRLPDPRMWAGLPAAAQGMIELPAPVPALAAAGRLAAEVALLANGAAERPPAPVVHKPEEKPKPVAQKPSEVVAIGNDRFNLRATLTTRGGGLRDLVLPKFEQADRLGHAENRQLDLVPEDRRAWGTPSFLLYHYKAPAEAHPDHPEAALGELEWALRSKRNGDDDPVHEVVFTADVPGQDVTITKTYTLAPTDYHLGLAIRIERKGNGEGPAKFRYQLTGAHGLPIEGVWYNQVYRNALTGLVDAKKALWRDLQTSKDIGFTDGGHEVARQDKFIRYAGVATQYFASVIVVDNHQEKGVDQERLLAWARPTVEDKPDPQKPFLDDITVRVISEPFELKVGAPVVHRYLLYHGPVKVRLLGHLGGDRAVSAELLDRYEKTLQLSTLTDYGSFSWWSDLLVACTNVMHFLLWVLHTYVMPWNYGVCIILLTVLVRGLMFPLSRRQAAATSGMQEKMARVNKELAPEIKKLEEKFKDDPWKLRQAKHELYLKHGVNPAAMLSSCWLMFAQLPIFLGLYYALQESINFRLQPFLWIRNLAAPDMLIWWGEHIPFISSPENLGKFYYLGPYFNLLPIIWVVLMLIQQKMMTPPPADEQQAMQQKMMKYMLLMFLLFFYKVPAGLCIYWIGSILWSLGERKLLPKPQPAAAAASGAAPKKAGGPGPRAKARGDKGPKGNGDGAMGKVSNWWAEVLKQARKK